MAFDWKRFVELGRLLEGMATESEDREALLRAALSRIYYGAFCYARNYARDYLDFSARGDQDDHGRLRAHLKQRKRKGDADRLERLRQWRNECDYVDDIGFDLSAAVSQGLAQAERLIQSLQVPNA